MKCDLPVELLSGYLDGELDEQQRAQVEEHLKTCPACQEELAALRRMDEYVRDNVYEEPSREFTFTLNRRVMDRVRVAPRARFFKLTPIFAPAAAALLILIILINISPSKRIIGMTDQVVYQEIETHPAPAVSIPEPTIAKMPASTKRTARPDAEDAAAMRSEQIRGKKTEEVVVHERVRGGRRREHVVRAIIDTSGTIIKVATGNTLVPETDSALENELSGQQVAPAVIGGKKQQIYVDFPAEQGKEE